jgi:hypothetical protein
MDFLNVSSRSQLREYAAIGRMQIHLRSDDTGEYPAAVLYDRSSGFIA